MSSKNSKNTQQNLVFHASYIGRAHTYLAFAAFSFALCVGCLCHYRKIVKNDVAGYPQEWFPSVSATIGDWYPERNLFQILIALTSGPRLALVCLQYYLQLSQTSSLPTFVFISGLVRTLSCGGWVYITSGDDHDVHDIFMITYMVCNIPWMLGGIACTPAKHTATRRKRCFIASAFFVSIIPLIYFFFQHKVRRIPGAYTQYSFFEWGLIFFDVMYDSVAEQDFKEADLQISLRCSIDNNATNTTIEPEVISETPTSYTGKGSRANNGVSDHKTTPSQDAGHQIRRSLSPHTSVEWRPSIRFLSDVYLSYIFWSVFTSLIPTLFYFSVWELGIAGHELALLSTLSPILLSISPVLSWACSREGLTTLHLLSFFGLAAYALNTPIHRLFIVAFATAALTIQQVVEWAGVGESDVGYQGILIGLGLLVSSLSKHANHSNNPVWPFLNEDTGGYNKTGLVLALLALYEFYKRPLSHSNPAAKTEVGKTGTAAAVVNSSEHWLTASIPLGSLIFSLHTLLSDSSTLIAWSWTGFENSRPKGPMPNLHGSLTLIAQSLGLLIPVILISFSSSGINLLAHPLWFFHGAASSYVMYRYKDWLGYAGGLNMALFMMSITPLVLKRAALTGAVAKTYFMAWLVFCILSLANIWTVAYAFVPGGVYLRERTDLVVISQIAFLALAFQWPRMKNRTLSIRLPGSTGSYTRTLLASISILSVLVTLYRLPRYSPQPFKPGPRILTAGIWTLHFGMDNEGRDSQRLVRNVIRDMKLDVVGFLETDLHRTVFGNRDLTRVISEEIGYHVDLGPGPNSHTWGAVLLSKFPIINSTHHLLPSPHGELAPAIEAVLDVYGTEVTVVIAHNGQEEDPLDRELQSAELARIMAASYPRPVIFLGYVVTHPLAPKPAPYDILVTDGRVHDIDKDDGDRWCEYILYRGLYRTSYARISRGIITDTELQIGQFVLPRHGFNITNQTEESRYLRSFKEDLPQDHWFPMEYYGNEGAGGVNGHFYHVFNTPLYYKIPEGIISQF